MFFTDKIKLTVVEQTKLDVLKLGRVLQCCFTYQIYIFKVHLKAKEYVILNINSLEKHEVDERKKQTKRYAKNKNKTKNT